MKGLDEIRDGTDRTSSELAIKRLKRERATVKRKIQNLEAAVDPTTSAVILLAAGTLIIVGLSVILGSLTDSGVSIGAFCLLSLLGLVLMGGGIYLISKWYRKREILKSRIRNLEKQYAKSTQEIEYHKKVVSMPVRQDGARIVL